MKALAAIAIVALAAAPAAAQPAFALGKPLPGADLAVGTISVRVIAGMPSNVVTGAEVTLVVDGKPRVERTDDGGRAFFKDLPPGATVQAKITGEDGKEVSSESFPVPASGGAKLMLSTKPMQAGVMPPAGGPAGGMPEPRKVSGQPRPEASDPPGSYTIRLTYNDLKDPHPPTGREVVLVGYAADGKVDVQRKAVDDQGRARFDGLDRSGATAYFAMARLDRGALLDRLLAQPTVLGPQSGMRVALSSEKRDSTAPAIDDLASPGEPATPDGKLRVTLDGVPDESAEVALVDIATHQVIARQAPHAGPPDPQAISGAAPFEAKADLPAGTLAVDAHGGAGAALAPLAHVKVQLIAGDAQDTPADAPTTETDAAGTATLAAPGAGQKKAVLTINGREFVTPPFDLSKHGGALHVTAQWETEGRPEAVFDVAPARVVYAEVTSRGQFYRSRPLETMPGAGAHVIVQILPRLLFQFSLTARVDDAFLGVQGRFQLFNNSWAPYAGGKDGITIPLPRGFKGGVLAEQDQAEVAVVPGEGFKLARPIPPGVRGFIGGFSLPVDDGTVEWSLDLPFGSYQSGIEIQELPGMSVGKLPPNTPTTTATDQRGTWFVIPRITILPNQAMTMAISGLPSAPGWTVWLPRLLGLVVVAVMIAGVTFAVVRTRRRRADADVTLGTARRQMLLDELVELERVGDSGRSAKQNKRREAVLRELEQLWG